MTAQDLGAGEQCWAGAATGAAEDRDREDSGSAARTGRLAADADGRGGIYVLREAEHRTLGHGHRPDLPGPLIYVAEDPLPEPERFCRASEMAAISLVLEMGGSWGLPGG
jgi:hypothetical protein